MPAEPTPRDAGFQIYRYIIERIPVRLQALEFLPAISASFG
jgi:hypothetical protein